MMSHPDGALARSRSARMDAGWPRGDMTDPTIRVWDLATGREGPRPGGHAAQVTGLAFSPDGRRLASSSGDRTVRIWDPVFGQGVLVLRGHAGPVWGAGVLARRHADRLGRRRPDRQALGGRRGTRTAWRRSRTAAPHAAGEMICRLDGLG